MGGPVRRVRGRGRGRARGSARERAGGGGGCCRAGNVGYGDCGGLGWQWRQLLVQFGAQPALKFGTERSASRSPPGKFVAEPLPSGWRDPA